MNVPKVGVIAAVMRYASQLRFPQLFYFTAALFVIDLFVPDVLPFVDEILLGLATLLLAGWKRRKHDHGSRARAGQ